MVMIAYRIAKLGDAWPVTRNGEPTMDYPTQEAAFESAILAAGGDLRSGHSVRIEVTAATDPVGARTGGGVPMTGGAFPLSRHTMSLTLTLLDVALQILLTIAVGLALGVDRSVEGHPAGAKTTVLVALAACMAMLQANWLMNSVGKPNNSFVTLDLMRMPLGILTGVGFIGGGAHSEARRQCARFDDGGDALFRDRNRSLLGWRANSAWSCWRCPGLPRPSRISRIGGAAARGSSRPHRYRLAPRRRI